MRVWERRLINLAFLSNGKNYLCLGGLSLVVDATLTVDVILTVEGNLVSTS